MTPRALLLAAAFLLGALPGIAGAQVFPRVVDIPTRAGVTQRLLLLTPQQPKAAVILFAGGHGGLQIRAADQGRRQPRGGRGQLPRAHAAALRGA